MPAEPDLSARMSKDTLIFHISSDGLSLIGGNGLGAGWTGIVDLELDKEPREFALPDDFANALDKDGRAKKVFEGLSNSKKQRLVLPVANAKTPETRQRNIDKALTALREGTV